MGALGDLWQIVANGTLLGQNIVNVFYYEQTVAGSALNAVDAAAGLYLQKLGPAIRPLQHSDFIWTEIVATNWTTGLEQAVYPVAAGNGLYVTGDCMPSFTAWGFRYQKTAPIYSSGSKRFAGVPEELQDGNTHVVPVGDVASAIAALQTGLINGSFVGKPVVLVTRLAGVAQNTALANPPYTTWDVTTVSFRGATTQRSRKA